MSKPKATKSDKGGDVVEFKRPTKAPRGPLYAEMVQGPNVDQTCAMVGEYVTLWTQANAAEFSNAFMWLSARAGQAFLMVAHDGETLYAASFWKLENWANGVVLRCVAAAGNTAGPAEWMPPFLTLARTLAKTSGAERLMVETYDEQIIEHLPEDAAPARRTYVMGV